MKLITREQWRARPRNKGVTSIINPYGTSIHWEGAGWKWPWAHETCDDKVRAIQDYHMDERDWSDIAYNFLACPHGYVFEGRGLNRRSAANGNINANKSYYAVQLMWGTKAGVTPVADLLIAGRDAIDYLRAKGDAGLELKGHRNFKETDCPGDFLYAWLKNGCPRPGIIVPSKPPVGDDMDTEQFNKLMAQMVSCTKLVVSAVNIGVASSNLIQDFMKREFAEDQEMNAKLAELQRQIQEANRELDLLTPNLPEPK